MTTSTANDAGAISMVLATVNVPVTPVSGLPRAQRAWLQCELARGLHPHQTPDDLAAHHPAYGRVVAFGAAYLRVSADGVSLVHCRLDAADEVGALDLASVVLETPAGPVVTYGGGGRHLRLLLHRLRQQGWVLGSEPDVVASHVDLADAYTLGGAFPPLPLDHALEQAGLECPATRHETLALWEAWESGEMDTLLDELRTRLEALAQLFTVQHGGPGAALHGSIREQLLGPGNPPVFPLRVA